MPQSWCRFQKLQLYLLRRSIGKTRKLCSSCAFSIALQSFFPMQHPRGIKRYLLLFLFFFFSFICYYFQMHPKHFLLFCITLDSNQASSWKFGSVRQSNSCFFIYTSAPAITLYEPRRADKLVRPHAAMYSTAVHDMTSIPATSSVNQSLAALARSCRTQVS